MSLIPDLGGKSASSSYSLQAGYTVGYHRFTSISNVNWNRSNSRTTNFFTDTTNNPAAAADITVPNNEPLNYGIPDISLSNGIQGLSETQPSFSIAQTIAFSEVLSWDSRQAQRAIWRRLQARAPRLSCRFECYRELLFHRLVY
ncbi:MAG: hypothetical protein WDM87_00595 [Terracidiphilus sp.]